MAALVFGLTSILGVQWIRTPFVGVLVDHNMVVNLLGPVKGGTWQGQNAGIAPMDQILAVDGKAVRDFQEFAQILRQYSVSDAIRLKIQEPQGSGKVVRVELQAFPVPDRLNLWVVPSLIGLVFLMCALWVFNLRRSDVSGFAFSVFAASCAICCAALLDLYSTHQLTTLWFICVGMMGGALIHLTLVFPQEARLLKKWPAIQWAGYGVGLFLAVFTWLARFNQGSLEREPFRRSLLFIYLGLSVLFFLTTIAQRRLKSTSSVVRQQAAVVLWGALGAFLPYSIWFGLSAFGSWELHPFTAALLLPLLLLPISMAYAILRYQWVHTDYYFSRVILYALMTVLTVGGYALLVSGVSLIFGNAIPANNPYLVGLVVFVLALLINPVRVWLKTLIDRVFFRGQQIYRERIREFSSEITPTMGLPEIVHLLRETIQRILFPEQLHVYILDSRQDQYIAMPDSRGKPSSDIQFVLNSPLPRILSRENKPLYLREGEGLTGDLLSEQARIHLLGAELFVPLPGSAGHVIGFLALAPQTTGELYSDLAVNLLESLCDQASMALERAQVVADLEQRVNETDVLVRIAQGINVTLQFDDILELIYAQAIRIVPTKDFWIMLYDQESNLYRYVFFLENDMRLWEHENRPMRSGADLMQEVIRLGQPIVSDNYEDESRQRGIYPRTKGLFAWVGVPLNAGPESSIGAIGIGSRDPSIVYASDQVEFLRAIADQAAGAIVQARLLENSERRARQLTLLNQVARNLTSTLELSTLLDQILENALEIISCEAGTLFLLDEDTGELVFEVVKGPVSGELEGKRLGPGTGHVGRAVETKKAAIVNQARQIAEWSRKPDELKGFNTRDLLVVPMFAQDRAIGAIEVINRRDGQPFTIEDQEFLLAFSSQAAIALENARLYTLTDQKLAERVEDLSMMQRIDRDLNTSLDITRAMQITLDWAMRRSGADAGLVGVVVEDGLRIMASHGYSHELDMASDGVLPFALPAIKQAVLDERTQKLWHSGIFEQSTEKYSLLEKAQTQVVIPIRRENQVIGLLMLESRQQDAWHEETQDFLSRLTDHAAIAIANAQLFMQVQEADFAKSEFVSLVSHELKTPMTSIRGYTDLLLARAVGQINEAQENFLSTVRSNVNRMATLVSDLADVSRIESGRLKLEFSAVDIETVIDEVVQSQVNSLKEKEQVLSLEIDEGMAPVWADRTRLIQVMTNLLSNANKYTSKGGAITIRASQSEDESEDGDSQEVVLVSISDTGIGIAEEDQAQVFTKFFRSTDLKARETPGTGLGLNITRNLVEMQAGKIWFESEVGKGTTFFFSVPVAQN